MAEQRPCVGYIDAADGCTGRGEIFLPESSYYGQSVEGWYCEECVHWLAGDE